MIYFVFSMRLTSLNKDNNNHYHNHLCSSRDHFKLMFILTYSIVDNYKDAITLQRQYETGCNTSELQSDADQEGELPDKRPRRAV